MNQCKEHLQIDMYGLMGILCDLLCHTTASMPKTFFIFFGMFVCFFCLFVFFYFEEEVALTESRYEEMVI